MRLKIFFIVALLLFATTAFAQITRAWPIFMSAQNTVTLDSTASDSVDFFFIDTTTYAQNTYFSGAPVRLCFQPDSASTGDQTDSLTISWRPIIYFGWGVRTRSGGTWVAGTAVYTISNDAAFSVWDNSDWVDDYVYDEILTLEGPLLGIRVIFAKIANQGTAGDIEIKNWVLRQ